MVDQNESQISSHSLSADSKKIQHSVGNEKFPSPEVIVFCKKNYNGNIQDSRDWRSLGGS